jgi:hypothetical protein
MFYCLYPFKPLHIFFILSFGLCRLLLGSWERLFVFLSSDYTCPWCIPGFVWCLDYHCPLLKPSPPLLPVQFTQSSLQTTATPIVCSIYTVKSSVFFLYLFLVLLHPQSQSLTRDTTWVLQQHQTLILLSHIAQHSLLRLLSIPMNHRCCCSPLLILHLRKWNSLELFTATRTSFQ